jgi:hypothetical protein
VNVIKNRKRACLQHSWKCVCSWSAACVSDNIILCRADVVAYKDKSQMFPVFNLLSQYGDTWRNTILDLGSRWRWVFNFALLLLSTWRLRGPQSQSGLCGAQKNLLALTRTEVQFLNKLACNLSLYYALSNLYNYMMLQTTTTEWPTYSFQLKVVLEKAICQCHRNRKNRSVVLMFK